MANFGWMAFDFDGTLAEPIAPYDDNETGEPYPDMVALVKKYLDEGWTVKILTARGSEYDQNSDQYKNTIRVIEEWCEKHIGQKLPVVHGKDYSMIALYDDRARQVIDGRVVEDRLETVLALIEFNREFLDLLYEARRLFRASAASVEPDSVHAEIMQWLDKMETLCAV